MSAGTNNISDLGASSETDILTLSGTAITNATLAEAGTATGSTNTSSGTSTILANNFAVSVAPASGNWTLTNAGNATGIAMTGSANDDTIVGGTGTDTITGGAGNDTMTGNGGADTFNVDAGIDTVTDLNGFGGGSDHVLVSPGATLDGTLTALWDPGVGPTINGGTASVDVAGSSVNLRGISAGNGWALTNSGDGASMRASQLNDTVTGGTGVDFIDGSGGADTLIGAGGDDDFRLNTQAETRGVGYDGANTTTANVDKITDFAGNGAAAGDGISLGTTGNAFGIGVNFTAGTTTTVTAVTIATAANFTELTANVQGTTAGTASISGAAQIYDITVTAGALAGRYMIVNNEVNTITLTMPSWHPSASRGCSTHRTSVMPPEARAQNPDNDRLGDRLAARGVPEPRADSPSCSSPLAGRAIAYDHSRRPDRSAKARSGGTFSQPVAPCRGEKVPPLRFATVGTTD